MCGAVSARTITVVQEIRGLYKYKLDMATTVLEYKYSIIHNHKKGVFFSPMTNDNWHTSKKIQTHANCGTINQIRLQV